MRKFSAFASLVASRKGRGSLSRKNYSYKSVSRTGEAYDAMRDMYLERGGVAIRATDAREDAAAKKELENLS